MKYLLFFLIPILTLVSCQNELETFNENPNSPTEVTPSLLLTATEVSTFSIHTSGLARLSNVWTQHLCGTNIGQFGAYTTYTVEENEINNEWGALYTNSGVNAYDLITKYGENNPYYAGMAKVLLALNISYATDFWNEVPYDEAFQGTSGIIHPHYQSQSEIYSALQQLLSDAIVDFGKPSSDNNFIPSTDDLIYNGDVEKWKKTAYGLKARFALRLSNINGNAAAQEALNYLAEGSLTSNDDNFYAVFPGEGNSLNQWFAFQNERADYIKMGEYFVNLLNDLSDPRLPYFATLDSNGEYSGTSFDNITNTTSSDIGTFLSAGDQSVGMLTYAEVKFIEAEAKLRLGQDALTPFKEAVSASLIQVTGSDDQTYVGIVTSTVDLNSILSQKYIALFGNIEPFNDYRRTGIPSLTPASGSSLPKRLPTPQDERLYNVNAVVVSNTTTAVWWGQ